MTPLKGVGKSLGSQFMAEIRDIFCLTHKGAITAFTGVGPSVNKSGSSEQESVPAFKTGSSALRKTLGCPSQNQVTGRRCLLVYG